MLALSTTGWWIVGYVIGGAIVLVAAVLLLTVIFLARRIVRQTGDIVAALDGTRKNTQPLFDLAKANHALERASRLVGALKGQEATGWLDRVAGLLRFDLPGKEKA